MKAALLSSVFSLSLGVLSASAAVIGVETFSTDGLIGDQSGGSGFDYDLINSTHTGTASDWDNVGGTPSVVSGSLVTNGTSAKREFNGPTEGSGGGDGPETERAGAFRGAGTAFFRFDITRTSSASWSGVSSYDFGSERIFFGVPGGLAATDEAGIEISGVGNIGTGRFLTDGTLYTMVAVLDFDNDLLGLYVNPDASDVWTPTGGTADAKLAYTGTNWSSAVRLGSGGEVAWDNLTIATTGAEVGLLGVPEPSAVVFSAVGLLALAQRRRR